MKTYPFDRVDIAVMTAEQAFLHFEAGDKIPHVEQHRRVPRHGILGGWRIGSSGVGRIVKVKQRKPRRERLSGQAAQTRHRRQEGPGVTVPGIGEQGRARPLFDLPPLSHHHDSVGHSATTPMSWVMNSTAIPNSCCTGGSGAGFAPGW